MIYNQAIAVAVAIGGTVWNDSLSNWIVRRKTKEGNIIIIDNNDISIYANDDAYFNGPMLTRINFGEYEDDSEECIRVEAAASRYERFKNGEKVYPDNTALHADESLLAREYLAIIEEERDGE